MTDRELLELAAKAARIKLHVWGTPGAENFADMDAKPYGRLWNPLTEDGDALRLAVKLRLQIHIEDYGSGARLCDGAQWSLAQSKGDPHAATRRAIVRAAAAIGGTK